MSGWLVRPVGELGACDLRVSDSLCRWATLSPERCLVARRAQTGNWERVSYRDALAKIRRIGAALLQLGLSPERPIVILSGNSIEHLLVALASMYVGIPYVPVSPAYSTITGELNVLRYVLGLLTPGLVAVFGDGDFDRALSEASLQDAVLLSDRERSFSGRRFSWGDMFSVDNVASADAARDHINGDTIAKFLLTSGSTGRPKAVITTHRMLCVNQAMIHQAMPFLSDDPPVLVDWLPWNHVFGGSHNLGIVLTHGGTLYIDDGRPSVDGLAETIRNLKEIAPTVYFNVPKGFEVLLPNLRNDDVLRENFFSRLKACFFAGAGLSQPVWDGLDALAVESTGRSIPMLSGLGATETGPSVTFTTAKMGCAGAIGLPVAGNIVRLVPVQEKIEMRVRGDNVTPGYWRDPALTAAAFDDEGFYRLGDAVRWLDTCDPCKGLMFDGRITEDFKLSTGTWVSVGPLRAALLAALSPLVQDVVIAGLDRDEIGALIFLDPLGCATTFEHAERKSLNELVRDDGIRAAVVDRLRRFAVLNPSSSKHPARVRLMTTPASLEFGEITDKGSFNQRAVLQNRADEVRALYQETRATSGGAIVLQ